MNAEHSNSDNAATSVNNTAAVIKEGSQGGDDALVQCATAKYVEPPCELHGNEASEAATATTNITTSTIAASNDREHSHEEVAAAMPIVVDESSAARKTNSSSSLTLGRASPLCFSSGQHSRSLSKIPALDGAAIVREVAEEAAQAEVKAAENKNENEEENSKEEDAKTNEEEEEDDERHEAVGDETPESGLMSTQPPCRDHKTIVTSSGQRMTKGAAQVARRANSSRRNDLLDRSTSSLTSNKTRFSTPSPTSSTSLSMRLSLQRMRSGQLLEAAIHRSSPSRNANTTESNGSQGGANNNNNVVVVEGQEASTCASTGGSSGNTNNVLPLVGPRVEGERMPSPDSGGMCTYRNVLRARAESLIGFHSRQQSQSSQRSQQQQQTTQTQQTQTVQTQQVQGMSVSEEQSYASSQVHTPGQTVRQDAVPPAPPSSSSGTSGVYAEQPMFYIPTMPNTNSPHAQTWLSSQTLRTDSASSQYQVESEEEALSAAGGGMMNYYHNNSHHRRNRSTGSMNCHAPYGNNAAFAPPWPRMGLAATPDINDDVDPNAAPTTANTSAAGMAQRATSNAYYPHAHHHHRRISTSSSASRQAQGTPPNAQSATGCNTGAWHSRAPTQLSDQASIAPPPGAASMAWFDTAAEMTGENTATNTSHTESHLRLAYPFSSSAQNSTTNLSGGANTNYPQPPNYHNNSSSTGQSNSNPNTSRKPMAGQGAFEVNDPYSYDAVRRHSRGDYWSSESYGTPSDGTQMAASASYPNNTINTADNHRHISERAIGGEEYGPHSEAHAAIDLRRRCRPARLSPHALSSAASAMTAFANALQMHAETHHNFSDDEGDDESSDSHGSHRPLLRETQPPRPPSSTEHDNNNNHHNNVLHDPSLLLSLAERKAIIVPPPATNEELHSLPDKEEQEGATTNEDNTMNIAVTAGETEDVNKEAEAGQSEETTSASLAMQQQRMLQTPGTHNDNMDEDDDGALSLPPHTSDSAPETIFAPAGDTPTMTAQQLVQLLESASNGDPSVEVCSPPGWSFSVYDADISQHYSIPSENIVITRGAIKYLMLYERYGQQTRFRFQLCKRYLHERCTSGAECHYIHSRAVPTSTWVHVNDNCVSALGSHRLTEEELAGGKNTQHYITMPPGVLFHVYPPNQGNSPPQIIPSELILYTIGATNVYRVLLQNMNAEAQGVRELTYNNNNVKSSMQPQLMYVMSSRDIQELSRLRPRHCAHFQFKRMCNLGTSCNFIHSLVPFVQGIVNQPPLPPRYLRAPTAMTYADPTALAPMPANTTTTTTPKAVNNNTAQTMMMMAATAAKSHVYAPTQLQQTQQQQTTQSFSYVNSATPQRQAMMSSTSGLPLTNTTNTTTMSSATPMTSTRMSYTQDGRPTTVTWYEVSPLAQLGTANERTNTITGQQNTAVNERDRLKYVRLAQQQASLGPARTAGGEEVMPYEYIGPSIARPPNTFTQSSGTTTMMVMMPQPAGQSAQDVAAQSGEGTLQGRQGLRYPSLMTLTGATAANPELHAQLYGWTNQQQTQQQQQASSPYGDARMIASPNTAQILATDARAARNARVLGEMQVVPEMNMERNNATSGNNNGAGLDTRAMPYYRPAQVTSTGIASQQILQQEDERTNEANELYSAPHVPTPNNSNTNVIPSTLRPPFAAPTTATRLVPVDYHNTTMPNNGEDEGNRQEVYELYNEGHTNATMPPLPVAASSPYQIQRDGYTKSSSATTAANVSAQFIRSRRASNVSETTAGAVPPHWTLLHATANQPNNNTNTTTATPSGLVPPALPHRSSSTLYTSPTSHTSMREYEAFMGQSLSTSATPTMYEYAAAAGNNNVLTRPDYRRMSSASSSSPLARSAMQEGEARNAASRPPPPQQQMMMMSAIQRGNQAQTYNAGRSSSSHAPYGMPVLSPVVTPELNQAAINNSQAQQQQQQAPSSSIMTNTAPQQVYHTNSITSSSSNGGGGATRYAPLTNVASAHQTGSTTTTTGAAAAAAPGFSSLQTSEWLGKPYSTDSETGRSMPSYANEALSSLHEAAAQKRSSGASLQSAPITPHYGVTYSEARSEAENNTNNNKGVRRQGALPASVPNSATTTPNMSAMRTAVPRRQLRQSNE